MGYVDVGEEEHWGAERSDADEDEDVAAEPDAKRQKTSKQDKGATIFQDVGHGLSVKEASQLAACKAQRLSKIFVQGTRRRLTRSQRQLSRASRRCSQWLQVSHLPAPLTQVLLGIYFCDLSCTRCIIVRDT